MKPDLAQYLTTKESPNVFGIVNSLTRLMQQDWFKEFRTDPKYGDIWIEKFVSELLASEYQQELLEIGQVFMLSRNHKSIQNKAELYHSPYIQHGS